VEPATAIARRWSRRRSLEQHRDVIVDPIAAAVVLAFLAWPGSRVSTVLLTLAAFGCGALAARRVQPQAALLPLMRHAQPLLGPALAVTGIVLLELLTGRPSAGPLDLLAALGASAFLDRTVAALLGAPAPGSVRAAYIGSPIGAAQLARALEAGGSSRYRLCGRVSCAGEPPGAGAKSLGSLEELHDVVIDQRIDLLVMGAEAPRPEAFGALADGCLELPVRLVDLSALFEEVFGHVPTAEIDSTWFQCLAASEARTSTGALKRGIDVAGAAAGLLVLAPLLGVLVLLIRRDGGPAIFRQTRIGEGGRPFRLYKLRTMRVGAGAIAQWASTHDPRVTRVGRFLRHTHLDELPQLVNVLRGEMSLVGPRPEQPEFVERLERTLPFYRRRHLIRPGITGWAQIRCGYAGSDIGSAWKLCHDLYYAKHRSVGVDLLILCETLSTLLFEREPVLHPECVAYVLREQPR